MAQVNNPNVVTVEEAVALHDAIVNGLASDIAMIISGMLGGEYVKVKVPADIGSTLLWFASYGAHGLSPLQLNTVLTSLIMGFGQKGVEYTPAQENIILAAAYTHPDAGTRASAETMLKLLGKPSMVQWLGNNAKGELFRQFTAPKPKTAKRAKRPACTTKKPVEAA